MSNDKVKISELFNKKERLKLFEFLKKYQNELIDYYNSIQNGEYPSPIYIDYDGNKTKFK